MPLSKKFNISSTIMLMSDCLMWSDATSLLTKQSHLLNILPEELYPALGYPDNTACSSGALFGGAVQWPG